MMLIGKSGDPQPVCLRALHNASPVHRHSDVRVSDVFERRIQISMSSADLNGSLKPFVQRTVIDRNYITTPQVCRDLVNRLKRSLIERRFLNRPFDEYKSLAVETY